MRWKLWTIGFPWTTKISFLDVRFQQCPSWTVLQQGPISGSCSVLCLINYQQTGHNCWHTSIVESLWNSDMKFLPPHSHSGKYPNLLLLRLQKVFSIWFIQKLTSSWFCHNFLAELFIFKCKWFWTDWKSGTFSFFVSYAHPYKDFFFWHTNMKESLYENI